MTSIPASAFGLRRRLVACVAGVTLVGALGACTTSTVPATTVDPGANQSASQARSVATEVGPRGSVTPTVSATSASSAASGGAVPVVSAAAASGQRVRLLGPVEDAPGALVPLVATVPGAPRGYGVRFVVDVPGGAGECEGPTWVHPRGVSQRCWVTLPRAGRAVQVGVRAEFAHQGASSPSPSPAARASTGAVPTPTALPAARGTARVSLRGPVAQAVDAATRDDIERCGTPDGEVRLSFDDGFLDAAAQTRMLAALEKANVRAWFFPTGGWAKKHPDLMARLRTSGHHIGNHTTTHPMLGTLDDRALAAEIAGGPAAVGGAALLRPGFGAGAFTRRVADAAAAHGFGVCYWSSDTRDWAGRSAAQITDAVLRGDEFSAPARSGSMVLGHMTGAHSTQAVPGLVAGLRRAGLQLEPLH